MNIYDFISSVISSLAWPLLVYSIFISLKKHIDGLLPTITKLKYESMEVEFHASLNELKKQITKNEDQGNDPLLIKPIINKIALRSPKTAILITWNKLEELLITILLTKHIQIEQADYEKPNRLIERLLIADLISKPDAETLMRMRALRNEVKHYDKCTIDSEDALSYYDVANSLNDRISAE